MKKVNVKRRRKESLRANGNSAYREWLHRQPCAVCGWVGKPEEMEEMHVKGGGASRKADAEFTIPACGMHWERTSIPDQLSHVSGCHAESHRGQKTFERERGINLLTLAEQTQARWLAAAGSPQTSTGD